MTDQLQNTEQNLKPNYDSFLIKKERIIKVMDAKEITLADGRVKVMKPKFLVRLSEKETFFYPQNSVFLKQLANDGEHLIKEADSLETADYAQMTFPKDNKDWDRIKISTFEGHDEAGKPVYGDRDCALTGLKTHFKEETAQIWEEMRQAKQEFIKNKDVSNSIE
ncbi:hypothetical protein [Spiroplasma chrysopicola]|uniref:Uncharacterized protein n=1 Tax=Spiroplasma chrysopicola DF-1 TaxID=1276227 RepID=R4UH37_9MOLU|nr:hypothetical protein [Spiroplasma chrysopicola]AGM25490.1 hypothetical protein SCHRY_v1c09170 [Spiroplasma chrysopicola DF-1]